MQIAADYLLSLINEVLQMSKIEEGSIPLTQEVIDFTELTNEIIVIMEQRARDRGIQMQFRSNKQGPQYPFLYGSPVHLRQIFLNIYGNCIKYNRPGGTITTVSDYTEQVDGITTYECTITDTGIGRERNSWNISSSLFLRKRMMQEACIRALGLEWRSSRA